MKRLIDTSRSNSRRGGAVIIVVISLLATLVFLGLFFFNWSSQEVANAELFADPSETGIPAIDPNPILDRAAEQLLVGTRDGDRASALWGGVHSLLAHQIGRISGELKPTDTNVGTGRGIVMEVEDAVDDGNPIDPLNGDTVRFRYIGATNLQALSGATSDGDDAVIPADRFVINFSTLGANSIDPDDLVPPNFRPNVDYTYPDINNMFLAHEEILPGGQRVFIPSFFRPQLFPEYQDTGNYLGLYANSSGRKNQSLRPHREHLYADGEERYLTVDTPAISGDTSRTLKPFPFPTSGEMGVFTGAGTGNYEFLDVDVDGDGNKDAIWMDLDLAMIQLADGRQYVPLISFKVIDADGLINLNVHGNRHGEEHLGRDPSGNQPISVSNLGMSRSEVNPLWSMTRNPNDVGNGLRNVIDRFGIRPQDSLQLANMEWLMLLQGWNPQELSGQAVQGRYGDLQQLVNNGKPLAGRPEFDIDRDNTRFGRNYNDSQLLGLAVPQFVHPLSPIGLGLGAYGSNPGNDYLDDNGVRQLGSLSDIGANNPSRWPQYERFMASNYDNELNVNQVANPLVNEEDETILEPGHYLYGMHDSPFAASESIALQVSKQDLDKLPVASRVSTLAAANFEAMNVSNEIRKRFTTDSWDRLEFNYSPRLGRAWETDSGVFPGAYFRQEIRDLFRTDMANRTHLGAYRPSPRHRLNLNGILSDDSEVGGDAAFDEGNNPRYRNLVPHPTGALGVAPTTNPLETYDVHGNDGVPSFGSISSDKYIQEWWARYDRQRLARDIYCLLWAVGRDENAAPDENQAREMAQFAVNVVDAMDRDNVITRFEYNWDLVNGWNPTGANGRVVYGIEHQELAFNEVLFVRTLANKSDDLPTTEYKDDQLENQYHSFIELRNASPLQVNIGQESWRIRRVNPSTGAVISQVTLRDTRNGGQLAAGGEYLISCQGGRSRFGEDETGAFRPSDFRFDHDGNGTFDLICPNIYESMSITAGSGEDEWVPRCDLDLMHVDHDGYATNKTLPLLSMANAEGHSEVVLTLERRLRSDSDGSLPDSQNPWVEIDRIRATIHDFDPEGDPTDETDRTTLLNRLRNLRSSERRQPFDSGVSDPAELVPEYDGPSDDARVVRGVHTMPFLTPQEDGELTDEKLKKNHRAPSAYTIWQPHFDRDFSSVMELLSIPLYGYRLVDVSVPWSALENGGPTKNLASPGTNLRLSGHRTAQVRFLSPSGNYESGHPWNDTGVPHYRNRWYRFLEFVDVPSQDQLRIDPETAVVRRTPGKINLNTIRHESVLAGLIDDPYEINPTNTATRLTQGQVRNWYDDYLELRDGIDPLSGLTIPGGFNSRPFRSLSYLEAVKLNSGNTDPDSADESLEHTILRHGPDSSVQGLFGTKTNPEIDYHTKNRILAKIANNSTTRSHVFFAWVGLDLFEAHRVGGSGPIQIGAKATEFGDSPTKPHYRMFCVIDMSRLEEAYNPVTGTFDFRKFIIHRQLLP